MSLVVTVDGVDVVNQKLGDLINTLQNPSEVMLQAAETAIIPDLEEASATIWNVRTGLYSSSNEVEAIAANAIEVRNITPYSEPLEYGWTIRNGEFKDSPGVVIPTVLSKVPEFVEEIKNWLMSSLG